jgi:hypothetical protein
LQRFHLSCAPHVVSLLAGVDIRQATVKLTPYVLLLLLQALSVEQDLDRARDRLCTRSDVQLTYLVTPVYDELNLTAEHWKM